MHFEQGCSSVPGSGLCPLLPAWAPWVPLPTFQIFLTLWLPSSHPFSPSVSAPLSAPPTHPAPSLSLGFFLKVEGWGSVGVAGRQGLLGQAWLGEYGGSRAYSQL